MDWSAAAERRRQTAEYGTATHGTAVRRGSTHQHVTNWGLRNVASFFAQILRKYVILKNGGLSVVADSLPLSPQNAF